MLSQEQRPAFEVHPFSGKTTRTKCSFDPKKREIVYEEVEDSGGFMVYFPKGHSIRVRTEATLKAMGFSEPASIIDMETGDEVAASAPLKQRSKQMTRPSRSGENKKGEDE